MWPYSLLQVILSRDSFLLALLLKVSLCPTQFFCAYVCVCVCYLTQVCCVSFAGAWEAEGERVGPGESTMSELEQLRQEAEQLRNQIRVRSLCRYQRFLWLLPALQAAEWRSPGIPSVSSWPECSFSFSFILFNMAATHDRTWFYRRPGLLLVALYTNFRMGVLKRFWHCSNMVVFSQCCFVSISMSFWVL